MAQAEKRLIDLEVQVEKFPKELEDAIKRAVKETTERLLSEAARTKSCFSGRSAARIRITS